MYTLRLALQRALLVELDEMMPVGLRHRYVDHTQLADAVLNVVQDPRHHHYLSTGCLHGNHDYCLGLRTADGQAKAPGRCKFCAALCDCPCHHWAADNAPKPVSGV